MKVLFAVNNDSVSEAIVKKYQNEYKEILTYKNVYYFNAILRELQRDKSYSRIVISEDLEPFANNNYDSIDKFLFDKYSSISEEAKSFNNEKIDIILICADRRKKTDSMLVKIYKKDIYNAIVGQDRSINEVCRLINNPRDKEEAKRYYSIQESELGQTESDDNVSEAEVDNIRAHYARLGRNEDKYVESFNNIVSQYSDTQLKIIIKYLPMNVKAVLEEKSPKYQQLVTTSTLDGIDAKKKTENYKEKLKKKPEQKNDDVVDQLIKHRNIKSVVIPTNITTQNVQKVIVPKVEKPEIHVNNIDINNVPKKEEKSLDVDLFQLDEVNSEQTVEENDNIKEEIVEQPKRGRGRPRKYPKENLEEKPKRGRGRPRKQKLEDIEEATKTEEAAPELFTIEDEKNSPKEQEIDLFSMDENEEKITEQSEQKVEEIEQEEDLFSIEEEQEQQDEQEIDLFDISNEEESNSTEQENMPQSNEEDNIIEDKSIIQTGNRTSNVSTILTGDKKIVVFVGTTKNGTSFVVNNTAEMLSSMGIDTAILDMTKSKNSYYIYTNNEEKLREISKKCMENLQNGISEGIKPHKNLSVYTEMPGEEKEYDKEKVLETLANNHSAILIDADFDTQTEIFEKAQEIYLIQTMDVLTIQPLTLFLRNLKSKGILREEKLRIVINKSERVRSLSVKTLIGGMSSYNAPSMTYMTELFDKNTIKYFEIPFEEQNYVKYLDSMVICSINLNGYTKQLTMALKDLANEVYPVINKRDYSPFLGQTEKKNRDPFSDKINNTLNKMKKNY